MYAFERHYESPEAFDQIDPTVLEATLSSLSDEELARLEDDLDFCNFAGVPSPQVLKVLEKVVELDDGWKTLLRKSPRLTVPRPY
ncbi:MAG: hypothetical protein OEY74_10610 [Gammaproteobacteria bacterium]|nr:hypothetical protein [Gammaproteobacteria bacterium]